MKVDQNTIKERTFNEAFFIINNNATIRETSKYSGVSKSTTHLDLTVRLEEYSPSLAKEVRKILDINDSEKHTRGGKALRRKYTAR